MRQCTLTHTMSLLQGLWFGGARSDHVIDELFLVVCLVVGAIVSARLFRWQ
jgi:hypothetical protein